MNQPLVSIIVPCYNQAQYLSEALESVLQQTYTNWECIIVNDGSPDNTEFIAKEWLLKDTRFKYLKKENGGVSNARNTGIEKAKGTFILPLDADDKISNDYISLSLTEFENDRNLKVVYCKVERYGEKIGVWNLKPFSLKNLARENMIFCSAFFRKSDWELIGGYDSNMIDGLEDWEFWIAMLKNGGEVKQIDKICFYYRIKNVSRNKSIGNTKTKTLLEYISVKHADFFVKNYGSFIQLKDDIKRANYENNNKLKSKKFVLDVFCKTFFGFTIFGLFKNRNDK